MSNTAGTRVTLRDVLQIDIPKLHAANSKGGIRATLPARILLRLKTEYHRDHQTRIFYCPPLPLLWGFRSRDEGPAAVVHRAYAHAVWAERDFRARLRLCGMFAFWPVVVVGTICWFTALQGTRVRRRCGKSRLRQCWEQLRISARHGILPPWYYMFELFDDERGRRAGLYLRRDETKGGVYRMLQQPGRKWSLKDKVAFAQRCKQLDIATPWYLVAADGAVVDADGSPPALPPFDLFAKPRKGRGGRGTQHWRYAEGRFSLAGTTFDAAQLLEHFARLSREESYLVQRRLENHHELAKLSGDVLSTVRVVTCRDEAGGFEATDAAFRMPLVAEARVDNFHAGGLAAAVEMSSGRLGAASDVGVRPTSAWHRAHPRNGQTIEDRVLPFWPEVVELAQRAHAAFPTFTVCGWDIAICDDGPVIIEGNSGADLDIIQRTQLEPLGDARLGRLLAHHLTQLGESAR